RLSERLQLARRLLVVLVRRDLAAKDVPRCQRVRVTLRRIRRVDADVEDLCAKRTGDLQTLVESPLVALGQLGNEEALAQRVESAAGQATGVEPRPDRFKVIDAPLEEAGVRVIEDHSSHAALPPPPQMPS